MFRAILRRFCRHKHTIREHRDDGWYWICARCGTTALLNPRDREAPISVGRYDEQLAVRGAKRARAQSETGRKFHKPTKKKGPAPRLADVVNLTGRRHQ